MTLSTFAISVVAWISSIVFEEAARLAASGEQLAGSLMWLTGFMLLMTTMPRFIPDLVESLRWLIPYALRKYREARGKVYKHVTVMK